VAKRDPYARHIRRIVDFILDAHSVKVSWMIVGLDDDEWSKALSEKSALDTISRNNWGQIIKLLSDPTVKTDIPTLLKLREAVRLAKQTTVEYGIVLNLADYLSCDAMVIAVNEILSLSEMMPDLQPFTMGMLKENCHMDFLIFVNSSRFSDASYDEKLTILAHEAVHIVEKVRNLQLSSFESIEMKAKRLVSDFKKRVKQ